ncbi:hypothetical protein Tsubulata_023975 [Turnera subulata]|uniref:Queuine tRNA-ribosyltransferase accessory subunit 2 n=1 Tax=Turnera subulata TaxID=218843 RepID=A0A9Q0GKH5_9ROSI|nr:hypothetical protein Tsubulata_023975 [Turnera subulata]
MTKTAFGFPLKHSHIKTKLAASLGGGAETTTTITSMKFSVKTWSNGKARTGLLQLGNCPSPIETPSLLLSTRKGLPLFISPDLLPSLPLPDSYLLQFSPLHFLEGLSTKTIAAIGGLHQMLGLHDYVYAAVLRDPIQCLPECDASNKFGASFETPCGRVLVKPADYMDMIASMKPNIWASLADEVPAWVSSKRNRTSVDRTVKWLDECIALGSAKAAGGALFGAIVGGSNIEERKRCAQEAAIRNVSGYWIGGFGLGESMDERPALLNAVTVSFKLTRVLFKNTDYFECFIFKAKGEWLFYCVRLEIHAACWMNRVVTVVCIVGSEVMIEVRDAGCQDSLQEEKPRLVCGLELPEEVLQGVAAGIDLFDSSKDATPIVQNCVCYTCQNHTKAYINHLLNVHEMLAQTLLEIHNTHHFLGFFRSIREAIKEGRFDLFRQMFVQHRREQLAAVAVCA